MSKNANSYSRRDPKRSSTARKAAIDRKAQRRLKFATQGRASAKGR